MIVLFYVGTFLTSGDNERMVYEAKKVLHKLFKLKDLEELKHFLVIEVLGSKQGVILNKSKYILELIFKTCLVSAKPYLTPQEYYQDNFSGI